MPHPLRGGQRVGKRRSQTGASRSAYDVPVTQGLHRYYGGRDLHFITCSCYRRTPLLGTARRRDLFLAILEQTRQRYQFVVVGYVVMPEHFHLLISEPEKGSPSAVMQVLKQRFARRVLSQLRRVPGPGQLSLWDAEARAAAHVWQRRFYDFNVWSERKRIEKLRYMHRNPVQRGLVSEPEQWRWSSYRQYAYGEAGRVRINDWPRIALKVKPGPDFSSPCVSLPPFAKPAKGGASGDLLAACAGKMNNSRRISVSYYHSGAVCGTICRTGA